jgi:hypothetical protein
MFHLRLTNLFLGLGDRSPIAGGAFDLGLGALQCGTGGLA